MNSVDRDIFIVGVTAYCEASNQGPEGIRAVAHSIVNRHKVGKWYSGTTIAACCLIPYAYSSWNSKDGNRVRAMGISPLDEVMALCLDEARLAIQGDSPDPTLGATHYYANTMIAPEWVTGIDGDTGKQVSPPAEFCAQIGKHRFYKGVA